jgi:hypothetical protein
MNNMQRRYVRVLVVWAVVLISLYVFQQVFN